MFEALFLAALFLVQGVNSTPLSVQVSGRVIADNPTGTRVIRVAMNSAAGAEPLTAIVDSDGSFEFSRVLPGTYNALAFTATSVSAPVTLTVGGANLTDLTIHLPAPKDVSGTIIVQGDIRMPRLAFFLAPLSGIPVSSATLPVNPQPDGSFRIGLPQGERQISVVAGTIPPGYKLTSLTYGATDLLKNPLRIAPTDDEELRVVFDATAITRVNVSGRVIGLLTTQGVRVVLMNPLLGSVEAPVNSDGSFAFSNVIPANYNARLSLSGLPVIKPIAVGNRDVTDVIISYPREFVVTGHTIVEGAFTGAPPQVVLEARNATGTGVSRTSNIANSEVIMLNVKDGEYNISVRSVPSGYQVKSITYGTTDLQKSPLKIDGPVTWEIIVRLVPSP